jgi:hypothetical protein
MKQNCTPSAAFVDEMSKRTDVAETNVATQRVCLIVGKGCMKPPRNTNENDGGMLDGAPEGKNSIPKLLQTAPKVKWTRAARRAKEEISPRQDASANASVSIMRFRKTGTHPPCQQFGAHSKTYPPEIS